MLFNKRHFMPLLNADGGAGGNGGAGASGEPADDPKPTPEFDYEKLASLINGKQTVAEDTVLKNYFKQQGLSPEDASEAIKAFKEQKKNSAPNIDELNQRATTAEQRALKSEMKAMAYTLVDELGITNKEVPYVMRMAELKDVVQEGAINKEKLKESMEKVLTELPQLKPSKADDKGFKGKVGGDGGSDGKSEHEAALRKAMGLK